MPNYRIIQYRRYHDTFVSEFFLQLANVIEVSRGRSQHQQCFKEQSVSLLLSLAQSFGGTIGGVVGAVGDVGLSVLGQREEDKKMGLLSPEHLSGQWDSLRKLVNEAAREAVGRYRHYLTGCSEADATELGRVSAQRLWEYLSRTKQSFSIEAMLEGILKGRSGFLHDGLFDTKLGDSKDTAEGVLKHSGIAYDEQGEWRYAFHPKDKGRYRFVLLPYEKAKARIIEKKYQLMAMSIERATELKALWDAPLDGDIAEDSSVIDAAYQARLNKLEQDWCDIGTWQHIVNAKLDDLTQQGAQTQEAVASLQDVTMAHEMRLEFLERRYVSAATLSTGWSYLAYPRDMSFQKRPQLWSTLEARFASSVSTPVVLSGLGGSGKTSLASEWAYAQKERHPFTNVRWLAMDTFQQFGSVESWAKELGLAYQEKTLNELWTMIAKHVSAESWLIVLDNVPHYDDIKEGLSKFTLTAQQRILITTRDATGWCYPITVDVYSEEDAVSYIEQQMAAVEHSGFDITAAKNLAQYLSYHPLALELAMAQICLNLLPLKSYQTRLERQEMVLNHSPSMQSQARLSTHQTVNALWQDSLPNLSEDALAMLRFLSFLDAQGGAQDLLLAFFEDDEMRLSQAVRLLRQQSLIKHVDLENGDEKIGAWSVHRLLQDAVRDKLVADFAEEPAKWKAFLTRSWEIVEKVFPGDVAAAQDVSAIRRGVSHGYAFLKYMEIIAKRWSSETSKSFYLPWRAGILLRVGSGEQDLVQFDVAIEHLNQALIIYRQTFGESSSHPCIANTLNHLGIVYQAQGDTARAIKFKEESLAMRHIVYASTPNHPSIANTLINLGNAYQAQGDTARAIKFYEDSLAMYRIVYASTPNHPSIACTLINLGSAYQAEGDTARAIKFKEDSLAMYRIVYANTPNHPDIALTLNSLGSAYQAEGDTARAIKFNEDSLAMYRIVYASTLNHPRIVLTLNNLGSAYQSQGNTARAIKFNEESLAMCRIVYASTPNHPDIACTLNSLGRAYQSQGDIVRAVKLYEESLAMYRNVYASTPNHPKIAFVLRNVMLAVSGVYLNQYHGSFFHARGHRKISELKNTLLANPNLSEAELADLVSQATINGRKSKEMLSKFYP